jgi:transposase-like protein
VRSYLRYWLSLHDVEKFFAERGRAADHTTIGVGSNVTVRNLKQRLRRQLKPTNKSWRVDETYIRMQGHWCYPIGRSTPRVTPPRSAAIERSLVPHR